MRYTLGILLLAVVLAACDSSSSGDRDVRGLWDVDNPEVRAHLHITDSTFTLLFFAPQPEIDCFLGGTLDIQAIEDDAIILDTSAEVRDPFTGELTVIGEDTVYRYSFDGDALEIEQSPSGGFVRYVRSSTTLADLGPECTVDDLGREEQN